MFNIGFGEMVLLAAIALVFIGPKQLPEVARVVGRFLNDLKRASEDLTGEFVKNRDKANTYIKKTEKDIASQLVEKVADRVVETKTEVKKES